MMPGNAAAITLHCGSIRKEYDICCSACGQDSDKCVGGAVFANGGARFQISEPLRATIVDLHTICPQMVYVLVGGYAGRAQNFNSIGRQEFLPLQKLPQN